MIWRVNADRVGGRRKNATSSCRIKQEPLRPIWICHITRPGWFLAHVTPPSLCHANTTTTQQQSHRVQKQKNNYPILNHINVNLLRLFHWGAISVLSAVCWRITVWMPCSRTPFEPLSSHGASSASGCQDSSACKDQSSRYAIKRHIIDVFHQLQSLKYHFKSYSSHHFVRQSRATQRCTSRLVASMKIYKHSSPDRY